MLAKRLKGAKIYGVRSFIFCCALKGAIPTS